MGGGGMISGIHPTTSPPTVEHDTSHWFLEVFSDKKILVVDNTIYR
jgi:hypothetical protein